MNSALRSLLHKRAALNKFAFVPMTDPAMQAAMGAPPQGGQPPMDPSMGGMPPQSDPSMQGAPMPPPGAPMDPSMGGQPPMPPQGGTGDPVLDQLLAMGFYADQQGNWYDPNGQPIPPEQLEQIAMQIAQEMGLVPPQGGQQPMPPPGAPMDPSMQGAPMDPNAMPPEQMPPDQDPVAMITDAVNAMLDERISNLDKRISAITDKLDTVRSLLEDLLNGTEKKGADDMAAEADKELETLLANNAENEQVPPPAMVGAPAVPVQGVPQDMANQMDLMYSLGAQ